MDLPNLPLLLLLMFASTINAQTLFPRPVCYNTGNFTADSTYLTTLATLLSSISTNYLSVAYGFFSASANVSGTSQTVYIIGSCLSDLTTESCRACLSGSAIDISHLCPIQKAAVLYSENCTVRYSNASILGTITTDPDFKLFNVNNVTSPDTYNAALGTLLDSLQGEAAGGGSLRKYATGNTSAGFNTIYAMTQCTPDLTEQQCSECLVKVIARLTDCCAGKMGVRIMAPSCQFWYETNDRFFNPVGEPLQPPSAPPPPPGANELTTMESLQFDLATIQAATNYFSHENKLGEGGFGEVFQGRLPNGQQIAVKRLSQSSRQGDGEFKNEILLVAKLQHRNLVRLLGFCLEGDEKLLAYEFVPNKSLDYFLFGMRQLDWPSRYKIVFGIARGILYLHEDSRLRIIHRDLKCSNILLDNEMNPKISDFGMARIFGVNQTQASTNKIVGTFGYMSPEYAMHGEFSVKSDVYSFGILLLEIICGKKNNFYHQLDGGKYLASYVCLHCLLRVQENVARWPMMASVLLMLNSHSVNLHVLSRPAFFMHNIIKLDVSST
ncbi:hypothetical protein BT93_E2513 [Corymbia citriodora subsp. variegata]|nr:hypothetical protein BT93_E2513 [Corymbia citriodora subsp. variegata]